MNPFLSHAVFKNTSLTWNLDIRLLKREFTGTVEEPLWSYIYPEWDKESILVHNLAFLLLSGPASSLSSRGLFGVVDGAM